MGHPGNDLACRSAGIGGDDRDLDAELVGSRGIALADTLGLRSTEGIQLPTVQTLLLEADLGGVRQLQGKRRLDAILACDLAATLCWPTG